MPRRLLAGLLGLALSAQALTQAQEPQEPEDAADDEAFLFLEDEEGITLTAPAETSAQTKVIEREDIDRLHPLDTAELLEAALDMPLVRYGAYGSDASVSMRGFDSKRVALLINGVPAQSRQSGGFNLSSIGVESIDRIEVSYGGAGTAAGNSSLGGSINIITARKQDPGLSLSANASNTAFFPSAYQERGNKTAPIRLEDLADSQHLSLSAGFGADRYSLAASLFANRAANHFRYTDAYGITRRKEHNEVWDLGGSFSWTQDLPQWASLIGYSSVYYADKQLPTSGTSSIAADQAEYAVRQSLMLNAPRAGRDDLEAEARLSHTWSSLSYDLAAGSASIHHEQSAAAAARTTWYARDAAAFSAAVDYQYTDLDSSNTGQRNGHDASLSLSANLAPNPRLLIAPALAVAFNQSSERTPELVPVPKLGLAYHASDTLTLKNNYFRGFKFPDFDDLYWSGAGFSGNSSLKSEDGWGMDIAWDWRGATLNAEGAVFAQWTADSIHWSNDNGSWMPRNISQAAFFGLDAHVSAVPPIASSLIKTLNLALSYQFLLSYLLSSGSGPLGFSANRRIPYMPLHTIGASLSITGFRGGSLSLSGHYESTRYADTTNIIRLDPYFLVKLSVEQRLSPHTAVFLTINNLLNRSYESMHGYPMPALTLTLGLSFK
jgi:vitamin B12 transporter